LNCIIIINKVPEYVNILKIEIMLNTLDQFKF